MTDYPPGNFIRNVKEKGLARAWQEDKELTAERNPNLARFHRKGLKFIKDYINFPEGKTKGIFDSLITYTSLPWFVAPLYLIGGIGNFSSSPQEQN